MSAPTPRQNAVRLQAVLSAIDGLPAADVSSVQSLIDVGEWLVAFETLCTQIYEWELSLHAAVIRELEDTGAVLGASSEFTDRLWEDAAD